VIITEENQTSPAGLLLDIPFGLAVIDPARGLIVEMNRAAERILGVWATSTIPFSEVVAGDGSDLLRSLDQIGSGRSSQFAFRPRSSPEAQGLIHGWACRVERDRWPLIYCTFVRPDSDRATVSQDPGPMVLAEKVITAAPDIVYVRDVERHCDVFIGGAWRALGYTGEELQVLDGPFVEALAHPADRPTVRRRRRGNGGGSLPEVLEREIRLLHRDGGYRLLRCRETLLHWRPGQGQRLVAGFAEDITDKGKRLTHLRTSEAQARARVSELEASVARLSDADRRKDEFLALLAHELRNPLAPLRIWSHRLLRVEGLPPEVRHASEVVDRQVRHLTRLVEDLREVSRFMWGKATLRQDLVRLNEAIELAVQMVQPLVDERKHALVVAGGSAEIWVRGDMARLAEAFHNLLDNAAKYTPEGGEIRLSVASSDKEAVVQVKDNGIGIDSEFMPRIFDLFARGERAEQSRAGGLGLGLSLVHQVVLAHGGTVEARSGGPGLGSEIEVRLPLADGPPEEGERRSEDA
jgi:signal transduction histidine kinase